MASPAAPTAQRLARAGIAGVLVRFYNAGRDQQVRLVRSLVHRKGNAALGDPQVHQGIGILRLVIDHPVTIHHRLRQLGDFFLGRTRPVHANAAEQSNVLVADAGRFQLGQQSRRQQIVGAGAG